jgi:hypothetical protein
VAGDRERGEPYVIAVAGMVGAALDGDDLAAAQAAYVFLLLELGSAVLQHRPRHRQ